MNQQALEKLNNPEMIKKFDKTISNLVVSDDVGGAKELFVVLSDIFSRNPEFKKISPALFIIYYNYLVAVKYVILFDLEEKEIVQLIRENFDFVLNHPEYDLESKIRYKIRSINDLGQRDVFKGEIRQALLECNIKFSGGKITIGSLSQEATVANWLKDYYTKVGIGKADTLKLNEYLLNNNVKPLSPEERIKLKSLLGFFENMKVSSVKFPMFDESFVAVLPSGEINLISYGRVEKIPPEVLKIYSEIENLTDQAERNAGGVGLDDLKQLTNQYPAGSLERKAVEEELRKLSAKG